MTVSPRDADVIRKALKRATGIPGTAEAIAEFDALQARVHALEQALGEIQILVGEQAEDEALWTLNLDGTLPVSEAYLQQELRRLHAIIENISARAVVLEGAAAGQDAGGNDAA